MAKLLIIAAMLFFSSKTGVSSLGTTTSPQQQTQPGAADKDPCEVLLACFIHNYLLQNRMFFIKRSFIIPQFTTHVYQAKRKTNPSSIISFQRQSRALL